jgi:hypothetical protein
MEEIKRERALESLTHMEYEKGKCVKMEKSHEQV